MDHKKERALKVADFLLQISAVKLSPENPFTWASGMRSPIYCDNRKTLSYPDIRRGICQAFAETIKENYSNVEVIAGVATGGIAIGALVAEALNLPFIYVRSEAKKHGLGNQVEGVFQEGQKVVVIEDLISTGKSSLTAVDALREAKADIIGMVAIFTYGFPKAVENFTNANCAVQTLSDYDHLLEQAVNSNYISNEQHTALSNWKLDPEKWSNAFQEAQ
ncbi:MAG: orotate phosphoribosyltransferase [Flavobacteriales bacterium]|jgi:orotate phosphoribosyltransferase